MKDFTHRVLDTAKARGASYADVRVVQSRGESVLVKNGKVDSLTMGESEGFGVRVIVDGAWGFASSHLLNTQEADRIAALAVQIARASALVRRHPVNLSPVTPIVGSYKTPYQIDPFQVSIPDKIAVLMRADEAMRRVKEIAVAESSIEISRENKVFASSDGSYVEQEITQTGCGIEATAVGNDDVQKRSFPNSVGRHMGTEGYEFVQRWDLAGNAPRIADEAAALLTAKQCPSMTTTVILDATQLALQVHESCGHPIELDRVFGDEAAFAGMSFLTVDKLNNFRYGSDIVNITADATVLGGLGTFGYDDEGVPAAVTPIIRNGMFVGYLTSRETAAALGQRSNGTMRADSWNRVPLIRMTNINLEPGEWSLDDMIAGTDSGIFMQTNKSWSIDDKRLNFQFGTEIAWEIVNGKLGAMLKNATYTGMTPQFWGSCDAIGNRSHWIVWGTPNCGKGQPVQTAHVGHGAAPGRFRNVRVGVIG